MKINEIFEKNKPITINNYLNYCGVKDVNKYLNPIWEIDNPKGYYNIDEAIKMFVKHSTNLYSTYIICDADLDGITSTAILYSYMVDLATQWGENWDIRILIHDGKERGLQDDEVFNHIKEDMPSLVIIPDAGTNDKEQVKYLKEEYDIDVLVLDHHDIETPIKNGILINNQCEMNTNISKNGSGCLVTYMFLKALDKYFDRDEADNYIDLVALSLISDSMDMSDQQNRMFYHFGLETIDKIRNIFLYKTFEKFISDKPYTQRDISFKIVPKFNSVVRSTDNELKKRIIECFIGCENDIDDILNKCAECHRNQIKLVDDIINYHNDDINKASKNNIVLLSCDDMPRSYSGLVAGKIMNICNKPTIIGKIKDKTLIGSLRSPIPLRNELNENEYVEWAIGHENSCGISIAENNINKLIDYYNTIEISYEPHIDVLRSYSIENIPDNVFDLFGAEFDVLWGYGIPRPLFEIHNIIYHPSDIQILGANKRTIKIINNGVSFLIFNVTKKQKEDLGLGVVINNDFYERLDTSSDKKYILSCIGGLSVNRYKNYVNNQMIIDSFNVSEYKPKTAQSVFGKR